MKISIIVAASTNHGIGKNNQLLWHLPKDMKLFKSITWAMPIIMGRKTYESLGKPLLGRMNIVITRQSEWKQEGVIVVNTLENAIQQASSGDYKECFIIGGGEIYQEALPMVSTIYLTHVEAVLEADVFFPLLDKSDWMLKSSQPFSADEKNAFSFHFQEWERVRN